MHFVFGTMYVVFQYPTPIIVAVVNVTCGFKHKVYEIFCG